MSDRWKVRFHVWPYHGVKREPKDYSEPHRGTRNPVVEVTGATFRDAEKAAQDVLAGIRLDERVWNADIDAIEKIN